MAFELPGERPTRCAYCDAELDLEKPLIVWVRYQAAGDTAIAWCSDNCAAQTIGRQMLRHFAGDAIVGLLDARSPLRTGTGKRPHRRTRRKRP